METKPTEAELEILSLLWKLRKATVRDIHEKLAETKETGYTTTLKIMQIMFAKGIVGRDDSSRTHIYYPLLDQTMTQKSLLKNLMATTFGGSAKNLVMQALGQEKPSREELEEIRSFLDTLDHDSNGNL